MRLIGLAVPLLWLVACGGENQSDGPGGTGGTAGASGSSGGDGLSGLLCTYPGTGGVARECVCTVGETWSCPPA